MSEEEVNLIIEQLRQLPIPAADKVKALEELLKERGITETKPYIDRLLA